MKQSTRGFVLLSVLLVMLVVGLLLRAAIVRMPVVAGSYRHDADREDARRAAESGLEYGLAQLRQNPRWRGNANRLVVDHAGMQVLEDRGNVFGRLTDPGGRISQFRLRFNYQDGPGGADNLNDPSPEHWISMPWISLNNLIGQTDVTVPRGEGSTGSVTQPDVGDDVVPPQSVSLRAMGISGDGDGTGTHPSVTLEGLYRVSANHAVEDAVLMAGGDIHLGVTGRVVLDANHPRNSGDTWVRLRTKRGLQATLPDGSAAHLTVPRERKAQIGRDSARGLTGKYDSTRLEVVQEDSSDGKDFYSVQHIPAADPAPDTTSAVHIPAGTYAVWDDGSLHYFDKTLYSYKQFIANPANQSDPGMVLSSDLGEIRDATNVANNPQLKVRPHNLPYWASDDTVHYKPGVLWSLSNTDMLVEPTASGVSDFTFVPKFPAAANTTQAVTPAPAGSYRPDNLMLSLTNTTITAPAKVDLHCCVKGRAGTITSEDDLNIVAGRTLTLKGERTALDDIETVDPDLLQRLAAKARRQGDREFSGMGFDEDDSGTLQLNIYCKSDVTISSFAGSSYRSLAFQGLMYSWGRFRLLAGESDEGVKRGNVALDGALVSYGNDPATQQPGAGSDRGGVTMTGRNVKLTFDPRFLPSVTQLQPDGTALFQLNRSAYRYLTP